MHQKDAKRFSLRVEHIEVQRIAEQRKECERAKEHSGGEVDIDAVTRV
jgi:hypothetical protein